jgi:hypothetical protein
MANTIDFNVNTNAVTVLNQTAAAADNTAQGFSSAKAELRALNNQLLQMDQSSEEFKKASKRAAELKDNISDLSAEISANAGNAFEGLSNNVGLFGSRLMSLDLKGAGQALSGMGAAVGKIDFKTLQSEVGGLTKGLANLGKAVLANPFFLAAGALTAMIVYYKEIGDLINGTAEKVKKLEEGNVVLNKQNQILDARINKEKTLYGESSKTLELEKEKAQNNIQVAENELAIARTTGDINVIREKENKLIETRNLLSSITAGGEADRLKGIEKARELTIAGYKEEAERKKAIAEFEDLRAKQLAVIAQKQIQIKASLETEALFGQQQYETERANFVQKDIETKQTLVQSDKQKQLQAELNQLLEDEKTIRNAKLAIATGRTVNELKAQEAELQKELNKDKKEEVKIEEEKAVVVDNSAEEFRAAYNAINEIAKQQSKENELRLLSDKDKELQINKEKYDALIAEADLRGLDTTVFLDAQLAEEKAIKKKYADKEKEEDDKRRDEKLAKEQEAFNARIGIVSSGLDALVALNDAFTKKGQQQSRKQFQIQKALNLASAVIDTYGGINRALNDKTMPSTTARIIQASIVGAMGLANVLKISKTEYGNATAPSGTNMSTGGGSEGGTAAPSPANFAFLVNQPNQQQPPLQAYVVGTQVSSNLEAQQLIQNQSRLGG